jgi:drug/metabolite transporter (DMT)-like permease
MRYLSPGMIYMLAATVLFAVMNALVKLLPNTIPPVEIVFFRSIISLLISYLTLKRLKVYPFGKNKSWLVLRGLVGAIALIAFFFTLQNMPLASAVTLQFLSPIFTSLLGIYIVKEKLSLWQILFFAISFAGVLLIKGFDARVTTEYFIIGVGSAFFSGLAYNIIRKIKDQEHPLVVILYFPLVTVPLTLVWLLYEWQTPVGWEWLVLLSVGVLTQFAQYFMTKAYQSEELNKVASLNYLGILYALAMGWVFFDEHFTTLTYAGMGLVLTGVILNVWYKSRAAVPITPSAK